jgi:transposase
MDRIGNRCQAVPDREHGIVFGLDIGKDTITYRACRPEMASKPCTIGQDMAGFRRIVAAMDDHKRQGYEVWVGYEPTGAYSCCILEFLFEAGWKVVQVNPKHTSRYNDIMDNKPGKSDPRDPRGIAGLIWQGCYRTPLHLTDGYAELRVASANWAMLAGESTRLRNQLHSMMQLWCPEIGMVFKDALCKSARAIVRKYPSAEAISKAGVRRVSSVLAKASRGMTRNRAKALVDAADESTALSSGQGMRRRSMLSHLDRLELVEKQRELLRVDMERMLAKLSESRHILSVKGMGIVSCASILGECGNIGDYGAGQLEKLVGLNLCEFSSGRHKGKRRISKCGRAGVRYTLCLAATKMTCKTGIYHDVAEEMRDRGKKFGEIRVAVARKLLRMLHALVSREESFDLQRFVARRRTGDDLAVHQDRRSLAAA